MFGTAGTASGTERVIVLAETHIQKGDDRETLRQSIISTIVALLGEPPDDVALAAPHTVLKTSSGKIRRAASREIYESGRYRSTERSTRWPQLLHLALSTALPMSKRAVRESLDLLYGTYFGAMFGLLGSVAFLLTLLPLSAQTIWSSAHRAARLLLRVAGIPLTVHRFGPAEANGAIIVANHSSYLDGLLAFHLGAFTAAVEADRPIVPVALRGARALLHDGQWLPRREAVEVYIGAPIKAPRARNAFAATIHLRDAARRYILSHCGEPDSIGMPPERDDSGQPSMVELQLDPGSTFGSPAALLKCDSLTDAQKVYLLREWYYDAMEIEVAEEEGMPGRDSDLLHEILLSLQRLALIDVDHVGASKQHGLTLPTLHPN